MKLSQISTNVIVWEWMNEFGRWRPYEPNVTQFIETSYQNNSNQVNLGAADNTLSAYSIDFITTCQIRLGTGTARPIRRNTYPQSSPPGKGIVWQWEGDVRGQWHAYDMEIACLLEDFYSQSPRPSNTLDLSKSVLKIPYQIDLTRLIQIRLETGRIRKIRRVTLKQAYPSGNGSSVAAIATGNSTGSGPSASPSPQKRIAGTASVSIPAKKFKSGHMFTHSSTANGNPPAGMPPTASSTLNSVGGVSSYQNMTSNSSQSSSHSRPITRSYLNSNVAGIINNSYNHLGQNGNSLSNFPPNVNISSQYGVLGMPSSTCISGMQTGYNTYPTPMMPLNPAGIQQGYYGVPPMPSPFGMFPVHTGLPGGSIGNLSQNSGHHLAQNLGGLNPSVSVTRIANVGQSAGTDHLDLPDEAKIPNIVPKQNKKQGKSSDTEIFEQFTEVLQYPPEDEDCCICCEKLNHASGYGEGQVENHVVYQLNKCSHKFHKLCLVAMYDNGSKNGSMQCPTCKTIYGEKHGNCPKGVMEYVRLPQPLPGYMDCQTIRIIYHISPGVQGPEHPHPGKRFSCRGFPRVCFLPDNSEGRKILKLLVVAWKRRLTFTIGQSTTTGESDTVTWNEIHHKTEFGSNMSGHGFPDDKYFENVLQELAVQGVTEKDI